MLFGEADGVFGWSSLAGEPADGYSRGTIRQSVDAGVALPVDLNISWQSRQLMHGPHAVRTNIPQEAADILISTMVALKDQNPAAFEAVSGVHQGGFDEADHGSYQPFIDMLTIDSGASKRLKDRILLQP